MPRPIFNKQSHATSLIKFISNFRNYPQLWNPSHYYYGQDVAECHEARKHLLDILQSISAIDVYLSDVDNEIERLKKLYFNSSNRLRVGEIRVGKVFGSKDAYKALSFLEELNVNYSGSAEVQKSECTAVCKVKEEPINNDSQNVDILSSNGDSSSWHTATTLVQSKAEVQEINKPPLSSIKNYEHVAQSSKIDCLHVVKVWREILLDLNWEQRLFAEKGINDVLFEASLGNLHRYSVNINTKNE